MGIGLKCEPKTLLDTFPSFDSPCSAPGSRRIRKRKTRRTQTAPGFRCARDTREYHSTAREERILNIKRFIDRTRLKTRQKEKERESEASDGSKVMAQSAKELFSHRLANLSPLAIPSVLPRPNPPGRNPLLRGWFIHLWNFWVAFRDTNHFICNEGKTHERK